MDYTIKRCLELVYKFISHVYFDTSLQDYEVHRQVGGQIGRQVVVSKWVGRQVGRQVVIGKQVGGQAGWLVIIGRTMDAQVNRYVVVGVCKWDTMSQRYYCKKGLYVFFPNFFFIYMNFGTFFFTTCYNKCLQLSTHMTCFFFIIFE